MNKPLLTHYAELKIQASAIEEELKSLQPDVLNELAAVNDVPVDIERGSFLITRRKTWTYTGAVQALSDTLATTKAEEQATGDASYVEDRTVVFKMKRV